MDYKKGTDGIKAERIGERRWSWRSYRLEVKEFGWRRELKNKEEKKVKRGKRIGKGGKETSHGNDNVQETRM